MAGAAEGVWLDSESIHPSPPTVRSAGLHSTRGGVTRDLRPSPGKFTYQNVGLEPHWAISHIPIIPFYNAFIRPYPVHVGDYFRLARYTPGIRDAAFGAPP